VNRFLALLLLALGLATAAAEDTPPPVPDPQKLSADWWTYFEPAEQLDGENRTRRLSEARTYLQQYRERLTNEAETAQAKLIERILAEMNRFGELKSAPPPVGKPASPVAETYTLEEALQRHAAWHSLKQEVEAESEESGWQAAILAEERKQQSRRRTRYLALDEADPQRLQQGLELMLNRSRLELQRLELDRRKAVLRLAEQRLATLDAVLEAIPERLVVSPGDAARWQKHQAAAEAAVQKLREKSSQAQLAETRPVDSGQDLGEAQYAVVIAVQKEIEIGYQELVAMQARFALELIQLIQDGARRDTEAARGLLDDYQALSETIQQQRIRWRRIAERSRGVAIATTEDSAKDARAAELRPLIGTSLAGIDQARLRLDQQAPATRFMAGLLRDRQQASENWYQRGLAELEEASGKSWTATVELLGATLFEINETPVTTLGLLRVVLILTLALWLSKVIRRMIKRVGERRGGVNQSSLYTFGRLVHYVVLAIGIIIGLSSIGIDFTKFALFASALGVGIGFGLQTLISNFVAGLIILFEKSLKVGDFVELESGVTGEVREINMRSTLITTNDNIDILVPNSEFVGGRVINWTLREAYRRIHVPFGVAYGTDKEQVSKAVLEAADKVPWTLKGVKARHPQVWFVEFGDSSLNFELIVWLTPEAVKRPSSVQAAYLWEIETKLHEYGIEVPFPQRDLHLRSLFGRKDQEAAAFLSGRPAGDRPGTGV
jgi:small-conductance mechanosensitive channel